MAADTPKTKTPELDDSASIVPEAAGVAERVAGGLERIREILFGEILSEIEKRLSRIDHSVMSRSTELEQDARKRTDVLETHVRKELEAQSTRATHDVGEVASAVRASRQEHREALSQLELRMQRLDEHIEGAIARIEREVRQQLLEQAKGFQDELARLRNELRWELARELGGDIEPREQGSERATGSRAPSH